MKRSFILLIPLLIAGYSCNKVVNKDKQIEAIKAVIEEEKEGYLDQDAATMGASWTQNENSRRLYLSRDGIQEVSGWSEIDEENKKNAASDMWYHADGVNAQFSDYEFVLYGNTAMVYCTTTWSGFYHGRKLNAKQKRILHFVKENGEWKYDLMAIYGIPDGNEAENRKTAALYHELKEENIDKILTEDFIGRSEKDRHTWDRESHHSYLGNGVYKRDSIFRQVAEGNLVATRFFRETDYQGKRIKVEIMHFKRFEDGKIAEIWEYGDSQQVE
jgi:hypothetical protein